MFRLFVCFVAVLNFCVLAQKPNNLTNEELCFVAVVYRHGDRAPGLRYPKDPHRDESLWPGGRSQLTELGKLQHFELGKWFRNRYWNFLPREYRAQDIYVRSTDKDRTLTSAYCNLAGLYGCWDGRENGKVFCNTIPVHTVPLEMDEVLAGHKTCPFYEKLYEELLQSDEVTSIEDYYDELFNNLSVHTGLQIKSIRDCAALYATLNMENLHGFQLPDWTKNYYPEPLQEISEFSLKLPCYTTAMKRLKCGPLLKDIIRHMEDKKTNKITQKMWMYSAHGFTIANLMQCLDVYDGGIPPYTAALIFELCKIDDQHYVAVSYKTPATFKAIRMPCCGKVCPFQSFKKSLRPVIPGDWDVECQCLENSQYF